MAGLNNALFVFTSGSNGKEHLVAVFPYYVDREGFRIVAFDMARQTADRAAKKGVVYEGAFDCRIDRDKPPVYTMERKE